MAHTEAHPTTAMYARVPVIALGLSLSVFFAISYLLCMLFYILFPTSFANHAMLSLFLPWFDALTWLSFLVGLAASIVWAWYIALVLGPLYNFFAARVR